MTGPLSYIGGKHRLAAEIISLLPEHTTYVEPFSGGAQVLFHKTPSKVEVLNDLDFDIVNFFRCCQWHHQELVRHLQYMVVSRKWYQILRATDPATLTDIQRAGNFFFLLKNSFAGLVVKPAFSTGVISPSNYIPRRIPSLIEEVHERLEAVQIESLPYERILKKYDRPETVFYLDPPYYQRFLYRHNFEDADFEVLAERLRALKGKFILSLNDHPDVRRIFSDFSIRETSLVYTSKRYAGKRFSELLITNYAPGLSSKRKEPS